MKTARVSSPILAGLSTYNRSNKGSVKKSKYELPKDRSFKHKPFLTF